MRDLSERGKEILKTAREHDGRYYIPRLDDKAKDECQELVNAGVATWVSGFSRAHPAIDLTSRGRFDESLLAPPQRT